MTEALHRLGEDFLSAIAFFAIYAATGSLYPAVGLAVTIGVGQLIRLKLLHRPIHLMQWLSLGLVIVFGAMTLFLNTPRLMMMKPSIGHTAFAIVMLKRGWMRPYLPSIAQQHLPDAAVIAAGYAWSALLLGIAVTNLVVAYYCDFATWLWFVGFGAVGAKLAALAVQYVVFRTLIRRTLRQPVVVQVTAPQVPAEAGTH